MLATLPLYFEAVMSGSLSFILLDFKLGHINIKIMPKFLKNSQFI